MYILHFQELLHDELQLYLFFQLLQAGSRVHTVWIPKQAVVVGRADGA